MRQQAETVDVGVDYVGNRRRNHHHSHRPGLHYSDDHRADHNRHIRAGEDFP